jgi:hypothetical protein
MTYETPAITELGSVADFTLGDQLAVDYDGTIFHRSASTTPTS